MICSSVPRYLLDGAISVEEHIGYFTFTVSFFVIPVIMSIRIEVTTTVRALPQPITLLILSPRNLITGGLTALPRRR